MTGDLVVDVVSRIVFGAIRTLATDTGTKVLTALAIAALTGNAVIFEEGQEFLVGAVVALLFILFLQLVGKWYMIRRFPLVICYRRCEMSLQDHGTKVRYHMILKLRSRQASCHRFLMRMRWTGESVLSENYRTMGDGYSLSLQEQVVDGRPTGWTLATFEFHEALPRWRSKTVDLRFDLDEPHRRYTPYMTYDTSAHAHSMFSRLTFVVTWEGRDDIETSELCVKEYMNLSQKTLHGLPPLRTWESDRLVKKSRPGMARWSMRILPMARYYEFRFAIPKHVVDVGDSKARVIDIARSSSAEKGA